MKHIIYRGLSYVLRLPNMAFYTILFISLLATEYFNFHLSPDISIQFHTLKNFVNGHGITLTSLDSNHHLIYLPCSLWPAGLDIFLSPVYFLTKSAVDSGLIMKMLANIFFILFLSKYFQYLKLEGYKRKFIILFFAVSVAPFVEFNVSDTLATVVCLWGFYFNLKYQEDGKVPKILISILLIGIAYFVKYSFLPFLLYPLFSFLLKEKLNALKKPGEFLIILSATIATVLLFYVLNYSIVGKMQMASAFDAFKGNPHWNQLSHFNGFLFAFGEVYQWVFENLFKDHLGINFHFNWISIPVTLYFYLMFLKSLFSGASVNQNASFQNSINISISAGALIAGFLAFLTLNNPGQTWARPYWTFVEETRYYGPVIIIGWLNILVLFFSKKKGTLLHIFVVLMVVLNVYAYRTVVQSGFWGRNYKYYLSMKNQMDSELLKKNSSEPTVVLFDSNTKNSDPYYYLQSQGIILLEESSTTMENKKKNNKYYELKKDGLNDYKITETN